MQKNELKSNEIKTQVRKPAFDINEVRESQKRAAQDLIAFGEAEGRRLALREGRAL